MLHISFIPLFYLKRPHFAWARTGTSLCVLYFLTCFILLETIAASFILLETLTVSFIVLKMMAIYFFLLGHG